MPISNYKLDWNSSPELLATQESSINSFLVNKTLSNVIVLKDEEVILDYTSSPSINKSLKVFSNYESTAVSDMVDFLNVNGKTNQGIQSLPNGDLLLIYS